MIYAYRDVAELVFSSDTAKRRQAALEFAGFCDESAATVADLLQELLSRRLDTGPVNPRLVGSAGKLLQRLADLQAEFDSLPRRLNQAEADAKATGEGSA